MVIASREKQRQWKDDGRARQRRYWELRFGVLNSGECECGHAVAGHAIEREPRFKRMECRVVELGERCACAEMERKDTSVAFRSGG